VKLAIIAYVEIVKNFVQNCEQDSSQKEPKHCNNLWNSLEKELRLKNGIKVATTVFIYRI